jgi:hypothetical protein
MLLGVAVLAVLMIGPLLLERLARRAPAHESSVDSDD